MNRWAPMEVGLLGATAALIWVRSTAVWSKIKTDPSRGGVMIETQHATEPDSSVHRATRWN